MPEPEFPPRNRTELIAAIATAWDAYVAVLDRVSEPQWTARADAGGWTVKDHVAHVTAWENVVIEVFQHGSPQFVTLQIPEAEWARSGFDGANALIHARKAGQSLRRVKNNRDVTHARVISLLGCLSDEDLRRPFTDFGAVLAAQPVLVEMVDYLANHYDEHRKWISGLIDEGSQT